MLLSQVRTMRELFFENCDKVESRFVHQHVNYGLVL